MINLDRKKGLILQNDCLYRFVEDIYIFDEVIDMLDGFCVVVRGEVEFEFINVVYINVFFLR